MFGKNEIVGKRYFDNAGEKLFITSIFYTLQGEGPYRGEPAVFVRLAKCNLACSFCFVGSTEILLGDGKKKLIEDIEVGDVVMSWSGEKFEPKKVTNTMTSIADKILRVEAGNKRTECTPEHPFLTSNRGWVEAQNLTIEDVLVVALEEKVARYIHKGKKITRVEDVTNNDKARTTLFCSKTTDRLVYNFEVEDNSTYIANSLVVHNCDTFFDDGDWMTIQEIDAKINKVVADHFKGSPPIWAQELWGDVSVEESGAPSVPLKPREMVLVMTGGEPMLQKNLVPFLEYMSTRFVKTQIESNGTIVQDIPASTTLVVSPKCSEKRGVAIKYLEPKPEMLARADCLKFVMSAEADSPYSSVPDWAHEYKAKGNPIFVSPMNIYNSEPMKSKQIRASSNQITLEQRSTVDEVISFWEPGLLNMAENQKNHEYTARYCSDNGFTLNLQIHLYASLA